LNSGPRDRRLVRADEPGKDAIRGRAQPLHRRGRSGHIPQLFRTFIFSIYLNYPFLKSL